MPGSAQLGPMTEIPTEGYPRTGTERILRWLWWTGLGMLAGLLLVFAALVVIGPAPYKPGDDVGYNLGLAGGLLMLSLLLYPLRKRWRVMGNAGNMRHWFRYHMVAGILGPVLILFHSTFRLGSMNGRVAFYTMVLVMLSGLIGRFLYRHIHRDMYGHHLTLQEAESELRNSTEDIRTVFAAYPEIERKLRAFREYAFAELEGTGSRLVRFVTLRHRGRRLARRMRERLKQALRRAKREQSVSSRQQRILIYRLARQKTDAYVDAVCKASQLGSWERLFSLWHVIHVPFLYLLAISGIVHVVAVHMY